MYLEQEQKIWIAKGADWVCLMPKMANRHGLIAGATGTGKTITLKVLAESFSDMGVPVFLADIKGDLSGSCIQGENNENIQKRIDKLGIEGFSFKEYPVRFFDVFGKKGMPVRTTISEMGPDLIARLLDLNDTQTGILTILFKIADDQGMLLLDLKDLKAMVRYVGDNNSDFRTEYGNISTQSIGSIQRALLRLEEQGGDIFFGEPALDIYDWMGVDGTGRGYMNILECDELFRQPLLYSTFMLWMLSELYENLPEAGDLAKPKMVFFFDEAHLLFENASKELMDKIVQIVKLIRSKGVGIFFVTQSPTDIPDEVLAQLSNRIQHSLRAYTPAEIKAVKLAADAFRANPAFSTADVITNMKTGHALVSCLDKDGAPGIVEETKILPPKSSMQAAAEADRQKIIEADPLNSKYKDDIDPDSAYEAMAGIHDQETKAAADAEAEKKEQKLQELQEKEQVRKEAHKTDETTRIARKIANRAENEVINLGIRSAKNILKGLLK